MYNVFIKYIEREAVTKMSFIIAVHVNEGIVLASDRRTTYQNTKQNGNIVTVNFGIHTTNSTDKTFICPNGCGISTCGDSSIGGKPITGYIQQFIREKVNEKTKVSGIPQMMIDFFSVYQPIPDTNFIVAGYIENGQEKEQAIFKIQLKDSTIIPVDTVNQGATWNGEILTLTRLLQNCALRNNDGTYTDLPDNEICWNFFTLQDAVDFAKYAVETTIKTMHFLNTVETVGGNVDLLVITPDKTEWLEKEKLHS